MKFLMVFLMGLMLSVQANTTPQSTVSGQVRLADGRPVAEAQVTLFDLADLHQGAVARARTDASGYFALPLASLGGSALPQGFVLGPNYPNPFNPSTMIPYQLPTATHVRLDVFNVLGQHVATLVDAERQAGFHAAKWDATNAAGQAMAAGVYFYRLTVGGGQQIQRMVLIDGQAGIATAASSTAATATMSTDAAEREYGLVVSGEGLTTYADAAFGMRGGMAAVELVVDAAPLTTGKVWAGEILGDVNNDGQVLLEDAMLVVMYRSNPSIVMPNNGSIRLGDVNSDGEVNETDVLVITRYISNPLDGALPAGIGQRIASGKRASDDLGDQLTKTDQGANRKPAWSPDGRQIAFSSNRAGNYEIFVMNEDGSGSPRRLTEGVQPAWSPDGEKIAFSSNRAGNYEIFVMNEDGSDSESPRRLTEGVQPAWSPDGEKIAFSSNRRAGNYEIYVIYVMNEDGSDSESPRRLTTNRGFRIMDVQPAWSPDGEKIAFSSNRRDNNYEIHVMNEDGSNVDRLTTIKDRPDWTPTWSHDSRQIAFSSGGRGIHVVNEDGSGPRRLTEGVQPAWSPDGEKIAFSSQQDGNLEIYVMAVDDLGTLGEGEQEGPSFGAPVVEDQRYTAGDEVSLALPAASGGAGALMYRLDGDLPAGLAFDAEARTLSGALPADALYDADGYGLTYRVADADGAADELNFTIVVMKEGEVDDSDTPGAGEQEGPSFGTQVEVEMYTAGDEVSLVLPAASGGIGELMYSLDGDLPAGLAFDPATRTLSGALPADALYAVDGYGLMYRVADADGNADELSFTIVVMKEEEQEPTQEEERTFSLLGGASMEFVWIEPGVFQMGWNAGRSDERPIHEVEISRGFWLGKYEITQGQWKSVMDEEPWSGRDRVTSDSSYPAVIISWDKVHEFIDRLNAEAGEELYRLPTEAEWEYACRAGTQTRWSFGDDESQLTDHAWYFGNNYPTEGAKAVGGRLPNPWGLYDMHGNVWEWVQDWYDEEYYDRSGRVDPRGPTSGLGRVIRGGHFGHIDGVRSAYRHFHSPDARSYTIGVRLLRMDDSN